MADNEMTELETEQKPNDIRSLRMAAEAGREAQKERDELRRQLMFAKAGIDWENDKLGKLLFKTWEGDDLDSLRSEAADIGIGRAKPVDDNDDVRDQADFRRGLSGGAPSGAYEAPSRDPREDAIEQFHADRRNGVPRETAALAAFDRIFTAAVAGDERVIFDPQTWTQTYQG